MRYIPHGEPVPLSHESEVRVRDYANTILNGARRGDTSSHEGALALPFVDHSADIARAREVFAGVEHLVLVGIGGSSLGTEAVYEALRPVSTTGFTVLDAISPARLLRLMRELKGKGTSPSAVGVCLISKSGGTTETIANYAMLTKAFGEQFGPSEPLRTMVITDEGSKLDRVADGAGFARFYIPKSVGGRYSVMSTVGAIPLSLIGADVAALLRGAREYLSTDTMVEPALAAAASMAAVGSRGVIDTFLFDPELRAYGAWRRQLLGESLGKSMTLDGSEALYGPLPIVSTVGDLHSIAQLYLAGPRGIHTDFVTQDSYDTAALGDASPNTILPYLSQHGAGDITKALEESVMESYKERNLPYSEYRITLRSPEELGALMACNMFETMLAASLMSIDAFDQPNVELYKSRMRALLDKSSMNE